MESKTFLLNNIEKIHTTKLGKDRIKKNLKLNSQEDEIEYCKKKIFEKKAIIYRQGKNYYCDIDQIRITINSYNYCIITAHLLKK